MTQCEYYDKGNCLAPLTIQTNACKGKCLYPKSCPVITQQPLKEHNLPQGQTKHVQWKSSNKGGNIQHKNFDQQPTKQRKQKWYDDLNLS